MSQNKPKNLIVPRRSMQVNLTLLFWLGYPGCQTREKLLDVNMLYNVLIKPLVVHHIRFKMLKSAFIWHELQGQSSMKVEER